MQRLAAGFAAIVVASFASPAFADTTYYPGRDAFAVLMAEDRWPCQDDRDYNDVVVAYNVRLEERAGEPVLLVVNLDVRALGATLCNGLGLRLPVPAASLGAATLELGTAGQPDGGTWGTPQAIEVTVTAGEPVLWVADDLRAWCGGASGFVNTDPDVLPTACQPARITIPFAADPGAITLGTHDLFVHWCDDRSHQTHTPAWPGTVEANTALYGTCDDGTSGGTYYVHDGLLAGLPFVLDIGEEAAWPIERTAIDVAMPLVVDFADGSGGEDFYLPENQEPGETFTDGAGIPLDPPAKHAPAVLVDDAGVRRWSDGFAATSCQDYRNPGVAYRTWDGLTGSGAYLLDPEDGGAPFTAYCDMATADGWTLVAKVGTGSTWAYDAAYWTVAGNAFNTSDHSLTSGQAKFESFDRVGYTRLRMRDPASSREIVLGNPATSLRAKIAGGTSAVTVESYSSNAVGYLSSYNALSICDGNIAAVNGNPGTYFSYNRSGTYPSGAYGSARIGSWTSGSNSHIWSQTADCAAGLGLKSYGYGGTVTGGTTMGSFTTVWVR